MSGLTTGEWTCDECGYWTDDPTYVLPHKRRHQAESRDGFRDDLAAAIREVVETAREEGRRTGLAEASHLVAVLHAVAVHKVHGIKAGALREARDAIEERLGGGGGR